MPPSLHRGFFLFSRSSKKCTITNVTFAQQAFTFAPRNPSQVVFFQEFLVTLENDASNLQFVCRFSWKLIFHFCFFFITIMLLF